jgi:hypothetical protein
MCVLPDLFMFLKRSMGHETNEMFVFLLPPVKFSIRHENLTPGRFKCKIGTCERINFYLTVFSQMPRLYTCCKPFIVMMVLKFNTGKDILPISVVLRYQ